MAAVTDTALLVATIVVNGNPAPQGSKKHVGGGRMVESSKHLRPWRNAVLAAALLVRNDLKVAHGSWEPLDEPLTADMVFTVAKPQSAPKRRRTWPMRMPDLSKLLRSTEDSITDAGIWKDDARVVGYGRLLKAYPGEDRDALDAPGALIRIYRIGEVTS